MELHYNRVSQEEVFLLREKYMHGIPESQELFLEIKVRDSQPYLVREGETYAGYCLLGRKKDLTEFYLEPRLYCRAEQVFDHLLRQLEVKTIWCKSFDRMLLSLCLDRKLQYSVDGYLFRELNKMHDVKLPVGIEVRQAGEGDIAMIRKINDSFFESDEELEMVFQEELLFCFFIEKILIGCGTIMKIFPGSHAHDIGMLVNPALRKKGYGTNIISYLVNYCHEKGWRPICGCDIYNLASRRSLEKAGFVSYDRLLHFTV
jgi:N-acetylglutamate synthase-like GNAT family acetyltransferase